MKTFTPSARQTQTTVYDKEAIAVAKDGSGVAYVTLTNFKQLSGCPTGTTGLGEITVWRTTDGGNTWVGPVVAGPDLSDSGSCGATGVLQQSPEPAIGPNGELYLGMLLRDEFLTPLRYYTGGRLIKHARYYWLLMAEGHVHRRLFGQMLRRIYAVPSG